MFYKNDNGQLLQGNRIENKNYTLLNSTDSPVDGWVWFESENEARYYLEIFEEINTALMAG